MLVLVVGIAQAEAFMLHLAPPATAKRQIGRIATDPLLATRCFDQCGPRIATKAAMLTGNRLGFHAVVGHRLTFFGDGARSVLRCDGGCLCVRHHFMMTTPVPSHVNPMSWIRGTRD